MVDESMKSDKLVRDKIPEIIKSKGEKCSFHIANEKEYWQKLKEKLYEETDEFLKNEDEEELADILEVINAICKFKNIDKNYLEELRREKTDTKGSFDEKVILD